MRFLIVFVTLFAIVLADVTKINTPNTRLQGITTTVTYVGSGNGKTTVLVRDANNQNNVPAQFDVIDGAGKYDWDTNVPPGEYYFEAGGGSVQSGQFKVITSGSGGGDNTNNTSDNGGSNSNNNTTNSDNSTGSSNSTGTNGGNNGTSNSGGSPTSSGSSSPEPSRSGTDTGSANTIFRGTPFAFFVTVLAIAVAMM